MKKHNIFLLLMLTLLTASCAICTRSPEQWLRGKTFTGPAVATIVDHEVTEVKEIPLMSIQFDNDSRFKLYNMQAKGNLEHTYTPTTCTVKGIVMNEAGTEFRLEINIKALPNMKIEYKEKMYLIEDEQYTRTVEGTLNEMI